MSRDIPWKKDLICDNCGKKGAYDYMGDFYCQECSDHFHALEEERLLESLDPNMYQPEESSAVAYQGLNESVETRKPFSTELTPAESERIACVIEECSEVTKILTKILRHGFDSYHPQTFVGNRETLTQEVGDLYVVLGMLVQADLETDDVGFAMAKKRETLPDYLHCDENIALLGNDDEE